MSPPVVEAWLGAALAAARAGPCAAEAAELAGEPLRWTQNPTYGEADPAFLAGYAYAERSRTPASAAGVLLLGPGVDYPLHAHPADEVYVVLTGGATFRVGGVVHADLPAGATVEIPSGAPHAMSTGDAPLLASYRWTGDVAHPAQLLTRDEA